MLEKVVLHESKRWKAKNIGGNQKRRDALYCRGMKCEFQEIHFCNLGYAEACR